MPRHREVPASELCPTAWEKMLDIVGGHDVVDPIRERYYGDQFIINFGSPEITRKERKSPRDYEGWHTDDDWFFISDQEVVPN